MDNYPASKGIEQAETGYFYSLLVREHAFIDDQIQDNEMTPGDELVVAREDLPDSADVGTLFHLRLARESGERLTCALLIREIGPLEALCEVLGVRSPDAQSPGS